MKAGRRTSTRVDADGVRTTRAPGIGGGVWAVVALAVLVCAALLWWSPRRPAVEDELPFRDRPEARQRPRPAVADGRAVRVVKLPARPPVAGELAPRGAADDAAGDARAADAQQPSDYGDGAVGIGAFPPPGTDPLKRGVVVPEDFELPEGFVRHYQTTDDGKPLRAILMFHPDYQPVDADGEPIAVPDDRVVPPELAPPGLEIDILDDPEPEIPYLEESDPD